MSRGCYKAYGRKINGPTTHTSIQFDKLFCENSNKPTASKSAGTVGKWGITSFTSIRSSNFTLGHREFSNNKRPRDSKGKDAIGTNNSAAPVAESPTQPRPKKFFKSRNTEEEKPPPKHHAVSHPPVKSPPPPPPITPRHYNKPNNRPVRLASIVASQKLIDPPDGDFEDLDEELFESGSVLSSTKLSVANLPPTPSPPASTKISPPPSPEELEPKQPQSPQAQHPPIVLRIFKGTSQLITSTGSITPESGDNSPSRELPPHIPAKKEHRRRSHGSDSGGDGVSPKRHKNRDKDRERHEKKVEVKEEQPDDDIESETKENQCEEKVPPLVVSLSPASAQPKVPPLVVSLSSQLPPKVVQPSPAPQLDEDRTNLLKVLEDDSPSDSPASPVTIKQEEPPPAPEPEPEPEEEKPEIKEDEWVAERVEVNETKQNIEDKTEIKVEPIVLRRPHQTLSKPPKKEPPKKGSIFKSRGSEKRNVRYIHNWSDDIKDESNKGEKRAESVKTEIIADFELNEPLTRVTNYQSPRDEERDDGDAVTSVTCSKKAKEFYTVVRNVKKAHQIQESGEFQEFNDDVEYILDALQDNNPISTRCLSAITLATKCMVPAFRMHVRAHGTVTKFFRALHDATKDPRLGMCTATVMFVLSQDRLNMDVDRDSLELMLSLLESDTSHNSALEECGLSDQELEKTKQKVSSLCQEVQLNAGGHLSVDNITVGQLAMETLLSLTSRRAGEWFKEELRDLGGLEHIIKTVVETCSPVDHTVNQWTPELLDRLKKADRCLRVLENVTLQNEENNNYLLTYGDGLLVDTVVRVFRVCDSQVPLYPTKTSSDKDSVGAVIRECLVANLKILINLTHDFNNKSYGSTLAGSKEGVIESSLHVLLEIPQCIPEDKKFDITVLALILLINLVEHSEVNRKLIIEAKAPSNLETLFDEDTNAVSALVSMFLQQEELARTEERKTDAILDGDDKSAVQQTNQKSTEEFIEETVALLLQKAGRHMEHTLIAAYVALLIGYLTIDNTEYELFVRGHLPNSNYEMLLAVLQKFYNFMTLTAAASPGSSRGIKATEMLIKHLTDINQSIIGDTKNIIT
ncbi:hypothetical protein O3M35_009408 [Rhynocoris fuscipes]|uniref:WAPL domain-containing protein n=1 Tax=Rhynocoris fuscipes TaxID=488301 RepID=A0AAW1D537_9HEMI